MKPVTPFAFLVLVVLALAASVAHAQPRTAGAISLSGLIASVRVPSNDTSTMPATPTRSTDFGGVVMGDLWANVGPWRLGGAMGVAPITSNGAPCPVNPRLPATTPPTTLTCDSATTLSRVILPVGASVAVSLHTDAHIVFDLRARGGFWAGATDFGLAADLWASFGAWVGFDLGTKATGYVGIDVYVVHAQSAQDEIDGTLKIYDTRFYFAPGLSISWLP